MSLLLRINRADLLGIVSFCAVRGLAVSDPKQTSCFFHQVADSSFGTAGDLKDGVPLEPNQGSDIWYYFPRSRSRESWE